MKAKCYAGLIYPLALVLLFGAVAPCGLLEVAPKSFCTESCSGVENVSVDGSAMKGTAGASATGEEAGALHLECCAGCLTCCASYTEAPALWPLRPSGAATLRVFFLEQGPLGFPLSIWHPPRV